MQDQAQVLVVDDDPDIVTTLKDLLEHEGYGVDTAETGTAAIDRIRTAQFHAVILDLGLPDRDGLSVLRTIRDYDPLLPVVILTAFGNGPETSHAHFHGAFAYLTKPYNRTELRATVARALSTQSAYDKTRQIERALAESEQRFHALVESSCDAIVVHAADGRLLSWNRATLAMFGYTDDEMHDRACSSLLAPQSLGAYVQAVQNLPTGPSSLPRHDRDGAPTPHALDGIRKNGESFPLDASLSCWHTDGQRRYGAIFRATSSRAPTGGEIA